MQDVDAFNVGGYAGADAGSPIPILANITGSGTAQDLNISNSIPVNNGSGSEYWLISPGLSNQEVVLISSVTDLTHIHGIFLNNHSAGETILKVYGVATRWIHEAITGIPGTGINNMNFIRCAALPPNIYDQYMICGSFGSVAYNVDDVLPWISGYAQTPTCVAVPPPVPQFDASLVTSTGNPSNAVSIYTTTVTSSTALNWPQPVVQFLFTSSQRPSINGISYAHWFDIV